MCARAVVLFEVKTMPDDSDGSRFPEHLLNTGFICGLVIAVICLLAAGVYLFVFLLSTDNAIQQLLTGKGIQSNDVLIGLAINTRLVMAHIALHSCGAFIGMSFGFLGFALFLLGIKGDMDVAGQSEGYTVKIARMSPGIFVIASATILIGICVTRPTPYKVSAGVQGMAGGDGQNGRFSGSQPSLGHDLKP